MNATANLKKKTNEELISIISSLQEKTHKSQVAFEKTIQKQQCDIQSQRETITHLYEEIKLLKQGKFGTRTERFVDDNPQGRLFDEAEQPLSDEEKEAITVADESITIAAHKRKKGRKPLPKDLPRTEVIHDLSEDEKQCACGCTMTCIGDERSEQLDIIPAKVQVLVHVHKKYACKGCEQNIQTAKKPAQPIPKSIATPGTIAYVATQKYQWHMPLYRIEGVLNSIGVDIPRATLSLWMLRCGDLLQPLVNLLEDVIKDYDIAYADESTLQVIKEPDKKAQSKSYMWCFGGGPPDKFSYIYQYHPNRKHEIAINFFRDYGGYLHCDGYQAYDAVAEVNNQVTLAGCWYHVRRKFADAAKVSKKSGLAKYVLKQIQKLSKIERAISDAQLTSEPAKAYRHEHAKPVIEAIHKKLTEQHNKVPSASLIGKAITYALNQWPKLLTYLDDGRLEISNNRMERAIKPFATGRKNWLFSQSVSGAKASANIYSLIETCKTHNVDPYAWLRETLTKIPSAKTIEDFEQLLPFNFSKVRA